MFSTSGDVQYIGGNHDECGGYHEYIRGCSVHRRDIMIHVGEQLDKILSISIENSDVLNIPRCTHDIPPDLLMRSPDVLMVSPHMYHDIPRCTEHPPMHSWYPSDVLNIPDVLMVSLRCTEHVPPSDVLNTSPPPMYSWYPPNVLNIPRCTEHTLYRVIRRTNCRQILV